MKHWLITAVLVTAGGYLGYVFGYRAATHSAIEIALAEKARVRATLERDLKPCYAEVEREIQSGNKSPSTVCHLNAYIRAVASY